MKIIGTVLALGTLATTAALPALGSPATENFASQHAVFAMTNDADSNTLGGLPAGAGLDGIAVN